MDQRTVKIAFFLTLASFTGLTSGTSIAQDKPQPKTKAQAPKSADHATTGDENAAGEANESRSQAGGDLARHDPRRHGPPAQRLVAQAGRAADASWAICRSRSPCIPAEPILAILHAGYGEHEIVTVDGSTGKVIGRVSLPTSFAGLIWSADGKRLFAGGGFDDRIYRFDHADGLLSKKTVFDYPDRKEFLAQPNPEEGQEAKKYQRVPAGLALTKDGKTLYVAAAFGHSRGPVRRRIRSVSRRARARGRQLSLRPGARRIAQAALCQPLEQGQGGRRQHRHLQGHRPLDRPRSTPTRCCWHRAARSCSSPTPTATR